MRGHLILIREAELLASSPERVYLWLEARATKRPWTNDDGDEPLEQALLDRHEPLVDIALARFCQCDSTAHALFTQANTVNSQHSHERAVRLALLSNTALSNYALGGMHSFADIPSCLFGPDGECFNKWLASASREEIMAMFSNPIIDEMFLIDFLEGKAAWQSLDEGRRIAAVRSLSVNARMKSKYSGDMDGLAEYTYNSVFHAAWKLAETLPPTRDWAMALGLLLSELPREFHEMDDILHVAERWRPEATDEGSLKDEAEIAKSGIVWSYDLVRQSLALLKDSRDNESTDELLASDDFAFRAAAYSSHKLTADQILSAYDRDKNLAVNCCQQNYTLWRHPELRKAVHDISWEACTFNNNYMDSANAFNRKAEEVKTKYPDWFKDEEDAVDESGLHATKREIDGLSESLAAQEDLICEHTNISIQYGPNIAKILSRLGGVWWFALGALIASLWHKF